MQCPARPPTARPVRIPRILFLVVCSTICHDVFAPLVLVVLGVRRCQTHSLPLVTARQGSATPRLFFIRTACLRREPAAALANLPAAFKALTVEMPRQRVMIAQIASQVDNSTASLLTVQAAGGLQDHLDRSSKFGPQLFAAEARTSGTRINSHSARGKDSFLS